MPKIVLTVNAGAVINFYAEPRDFNFESFNGSLYAIVDKVTFINWLGAKVAKKLGLSEAKSHIFAAMDLTNLIFAARAAEGYQPLTWESFCKFNEEFIDETLELGQSDDIDLD